MYPCNKQNDVYNCGVYVLFYVEQCLKNGAVEIDKCFNCLYYRYNLKKLIFITCEDATNTCVKCSFEVVYAQDDVEVENGVKCDNCDRWVHLKCTLNSNKN
jgi:hypothetical protein